MNMINREAEAHANVTRFNELRSLQQSKDANLHEAAFQIIPIFPFLEIPIFSYQCL